MHPFRQLTPKHKKDRKVCLLYTSYKKTLRIDFNKRCGYCNDLDTNRIRSYVIDHFVPQNPDGWTHSIQPNVYSNLIYACSFCNGKKGNKWPTKNANKSHNGSDGFIKPTQKAYGNIFRRDTDGSIIIHNKNPIGIYIHRELSFDLPIHSLNWRFEKILEQEKTLELLNKKISDPILKQEIKDIKILRLEIVDNINGIYNS